MARQGLPKKYAKMGFKKGWREYKKSKSTRTPTRRRSPTRAKATTRRRSTTIRTTSRKRVSRRRNNMKFGNKAIVGGVVAGALAGVLQQYTGIAFADDIALLGYGLFSKNTTLQTIGAIGLGNDLVNTMLPKIGVGGNGSGVLGA